MTEIRISKKQLLDCLLRLRKGFNLKAMYIINDYKFEVDGNKMTVSVCDSNVLWMTESFMLPDKAVTSDGEPRRSWCVNRHYIIPGLRSLEDQDITLKVQDYQMSVNHSYGSFSMPIEDVNEYPNFGFSLTNKEGRDHSTHLKLEAPGMLHWLYMLKPSTACDELRPTMNGIAFNLSPEGLELAASDGHKLVRIHKQSITGNKKNIIIPKKAIDVLLDVLPKTGEIGFSFTEYESHNETFLNGRSYTVHDVKATGRIDIEIDSDTEHTLQLWFRGIEGRYPNYNSVIPVNNPFSISVDRRMMIKCLERARLFCNDLSGLVKFDITKDRVGFMAESIDYNLSSCDNISCESRCGDFDRLSLGVKAINVLQLIKRLTTDTILFYFTDESRAFIIEPEPQPEVENITMLFMPMFIGD